jgi:isochorismate synthase EntC
LNSIINIVKEFSDEDVSKHASEHIYSSTKDITDQADQTNKQSKIDELKDKKVKYLSSSSSFERFTTESSNSSASVTAVKVVKSKKMIDLNLDTVNILSEKMRRRRDASRKQTYSIALTQMIENEVTSYHMTFFAFISVSAFYNARINASTKTSTNVKITFFHKDTLSLESKNFRQMQKHSHKTDFNQVIYTKITALKVKSIRKKISINNVFEKIIISTM